MLAATAEIDRATAELHELELALARSPEPAPAGDPAVAFQSLQGRLASVSERFEADKCVDPAVITPAEAHSTQLLQGFRTNWLRGKHSMAVIGG